MKTLLTTLIFLIATGVYSQTRITTKDLQVLLGAWEGSLTYIDYQSNKPFTMPANLTVEPGKNSNTLILKNIYPNEPKANNTEKLKLTKEGTFLNKNKVIVRQELESGAVRIQTEYNGKDDNKKALIRYTYIVSNDLFNTVKEVQFNEGESWITRSEFTYTRVK